MTSIRQVYFLRESIYLAHPTIMWEIFVLMKNLELCRSVSVVCMNLIRVLWFRSSLSRYFLTLELRLWLVWPILEVFNVVCFISEESNICHGLFNRCGDFLKISMWTQLTEIYFTCVYESPGEIDVLAILLETFLRLKCVDFKGNLS